MSTIIGERRPDTGSRIARIIMGLLFVGVGVWVFLTPIASYLTLAFLFSLAFLISGILEIVSAIGASKTSENWGWTLVGGIIDFLIGLLLIFQPAISVVVLPLFIGFAILFRSIMSVGWSIRLKKIGIRDWGFLLLLGILGILFSFILLFNPLFAGFTIVFYTAIAFVIAGIIQIVFALRSRHF